MPSPTRPNLIDEIHGELREFIARVILRNQGFADQLDVHPVDLQCLNLIALASSPLTPGQIAERAGLASSTATRVLDRLEVAGYIQRVRDTRDRRKVFVHPNPAQLERLTSLYERQQAGIATVTDDLGDLDLTVVLRFLRAANRPVAVGDRLLGQSSEGLS